MGGVSSLKILLISDIEEYRNINNQVKIILVEEKAFKDIYFSYKSAKVEVTEISENLYSINIHFLSPKNRIELYNETKEFVNQKVIVLIKFSNGVEIVYGSIYCPLIMKYSPTLQSIPSDYNGLSYTLSCKDYSPGRYLYIEEPEEEPEEE